MNSIVFSLGASAFAITPSPANGAIVLEISGAGITNHSGITQNFVTYGDEDSSSFIFFTRSATAGSGTLFTCNPGPIPGGRGQIYFYDNASAGDAAFVDNGGYIYFFDNSTAADATIIANGSPSADQAAGVVYLGSTNAGNATLIANGGTYGGFISISGDGPNTARAKLYDNGLLYIGYSGSNPMVGSIEGNGKIIVALDQNFSVGNNNLSTVFSGVIQDDPSPPILESSSLVGQTQPESGGALTKIGTGTLALTGPSRYTGETIVTAGVLKVGNKTRSATGRRAVNVNAGTLGGKGTIAGITTIGTGIGAGSFLAPSVGADRPATLTFRRALICKKDATYIYKLNTRNASSDQVIAKGLRIESGAQFDFQPVANNQLTIGTVFTAIDNTSANPIAGTFANLADDSTITIGSNTFQADYQGGDGNDLTLTVIP